MPPQTQFSATAGVFLFVFGFFLLIGMVTGIWKLKFAFRATEMGFSELAPIFEQDAPRTDASDEHQYSTRNDTRREPCRRHA
jgi:hypothetical protein